MNAIQKRLLQIAQVFKEVCEEFQLQYFMTGGTLLGAVRHQGFIPWDDDMDFVMPRVDYERFIQLFEEGKLQNFMSSYNLRYIKPNDTYYFPFIKLEDVNTTVIDKYRSPTQKVIKFPFCGNSGEGGNVVYQTMGLNIDIFPLEYVNRYCKRRYITHFGIFRLMSQFPDCDITRLSRSPLKKILFAVIKALPREYVLKRLAYTMRFGSQKTIHKYVSTWYLLWCSRKYFYKEDFNESVSLPFEGTLFSAPKNFHRNLNMQYGDYMLLPPEEERFTHYNDDTIVRLDLPYKDCEYKDFLTYCDKKE